MRQSVRSTVSTATTTSSTSSRCVRVSLLNEQHITVFIERKAKVQEVFSQVCEQLGLRETEYFGLAQHIDDEYYFVELDTKLDKLVPSKTWRASRKFGDDNPVLTLYFRVQYYIEHISLLKEKVTRHWYYHQLKDNLLNYRHLVGEEKCFLLAAYSLQADHGNYNCQKHTVDYFDPNKYFPAWVVSRRGRDYIVQNMPTLHRDCHGMSRLKALMHFIHEISMPPFAHNLHFYKLKKKKVEELGTAWLGLCPKGIEIYEEENGFKSLLSTFLWNDVGKLFFEKKKFEIRASGAAERKFTYYTGSDTRSKYLLGLCRGTHQFEMSMQPKLAKIRYMEAEDRNRELCVSSDGSDLSRSRSWRSSCRAPGVFVQKPNRQSPAHTTPGQRTSLYSNVSSNATSDGVVDRIMASLETDRRSQEIMIDTPPHPPTSMHFVHNLSPLVSSSAVTSPISLPPKDRRSALLGASAMTPVVTTQSTPTKCHKNPVSKPLSTNSASVSRSSSDQSQKSAKLTTMAVAKDPPANLSSQPAMPKPAEAHIQRVTFAHTMTVTSTRVPPGVGGVMGNVAISSSQAVRDFAIPVITASPITSINNARPGDNLVVPALPVPYSVTPISNISPATASVPAIKTSQHTVPSLSALAAVEQHSAIYHSAISDSPVSLANNIISGNHMSNSHKTFEDHTYVNGDMMSQAVNVSTPAQFPLQPLSMSSLPQLNTPVESYRSTQPVTAQYGGDPRSIPAANAINSASSSQFLLQQTTPANLTSQPTKLAVSTQQQYNVTSQPAQSLPSNTQSQHFMPAKHTNNNYQIAGIPAKSVNQLQYGMDSAPSMTVNSTGDMPQFLMQQYGAFPQSTTSFQDQSIVQPPYPQQVEQPSYTQKMEPSTQGTGISNTPANQPQYNEYMVQQVSSSNLPTSSTQFKQTTAVETPAASQPFTVNIDSQTAAPSTSLTVLPPSSRAANNTHQAIAARSTNDIASSNRTQQAPPYHLPEAAHAAANLQEIRGAKRLQAGLRRSTHEDCPQHGVRSNILAEIRGRGSNNKTPLLSALCNDKTLVDTCTCEKGKDSDKLKRMSYSHPTPTTLSNEPGTVLRPMSWHSEHFNLDQSLQVYDILNLCNNRANGAPPAYGQQQCTPNRGWPSAGNVGCSQDVGLEQPNGSVPIIPFSVNS